jgi:signal transduction histidine kinase
VDLAEEGLAAALQRLADETESVSAVPCSCSIAGDGLVYDNSTATHLYYIAREAVGNAVRHGNPTQVEIRLNTDDDRGELSVADDGCGIAGAGTDSGMGLRIMRFRAESMGGQLAIRKRPERGTTVTCRFPNVTRVRPDPDPHGA